MGELGKGKKQHVDFVAHRLQSTAVAFHAPIKINKIHLPGNRHKNRNKSKHVDSTKEDMHLLGQLCMTLHFREGNSDRLFEVENAECPPSLSKHAKQLLPSPSLWGWVKSEIGGVPSWTALPRAANVMNVLISCGCTTSSTGKYGSCYNKGIVCTARCRCSGHCYGCSNPPPMPPSN